MRSVGLPPIAPVSSSAHLVHFYHHGQELLDASARFCSAGLKEGECCLWVTIPPWSADVALYSLKTYFPAPEGCVATGQLQFITNEDWNRAVQGLDREAIQEHLMGIAKSARKLGWPHVRICGKSFRPLAAEDWVERLRYEEALHGVIRASGALVLCCYRQGNMPATVKQGLLRSHDAVLTAEEDGWHSTSFNK